MTIATRIHSDIPTFIRSTSSIATGFKISLLEKARQGRVFAHSGVKARKVNEKFESLAQKETAQVFAFPPSGELIQLFESPKFRQNCA